MFARRSLKALSTGASARSMHHQKACVSRNSFDLSGDFAAVRAKAEHMAAHPPPGVGRYREDVFRGNEPFYAGGPFLTVAQEGERIRTFEIVGAYPNCPFGVEFMEASADCATLNKFIYSAGYVTKNIHGSNLSAGVHDVTVVESIVPLVDGCWDEFTAASDAARDALLAAPSMKGALAQFGGLTEGQSNFETARSPQVNHTDEGYCLVATTIWEGHDSDGPAKLEANAAADYAAAGLDKFITGPIQRTVMNGLVCVAAE